MNWCSDTMCTCDVSVIMCCTLSTIPCCTISNISSCVVPVVHCTGTTVCCTFCTWWDEVMMRGSCDNDDEIWWWWYGDGDREEEVVILVVVIVVYYRVVYLCYCCYCYISHYVSVCQETCKSRQRRLFWAIITVTFLKMKYYTNNSTMDRCFTCWNLSFFSS